MVNLLESSERTLEIFESVCSGLAECLALVHADIKQMSERRNQLAQLAQLEEEALQAKLADPARGPLELQETAPGQQLMQTNLDQSSSADGEHDDPHHLARLKLLDKRLADSFSQALSLCDQQRSSLVLKKQQYQQAGNGHTRPSIFQVLLGKTSSKQQQQHSAANEANTRRSSKQSSKLQQQQQPQTPPPPQRADNRAKIEHINRQTRLAMQYAKQLEAHLFRVEDLRANYEMHLKMGLVVRSVSRAYSSSTSTSTSGASSHYHSPNSLGRRPQHHASSLLVNETSSLGTAHSSLSSLNLSSWSFSRRQKSSTSDRSWGSRQLPNASSACCGAAGQFVCAAPADDCLILGRQLQLEPSEEQRQTPAREYVSTISLDGTASRRQQRATPCCMISTCGPPAARRHELDRPASLLEEAKHVDAIYSPQYQPSQHAQQQQQQQQHREPASAASCQCQLARSAGEQASVIYVNGGHRGRATPSPRPSSHYGDFVAATSAGTLSSRNASNYRAATAHQAPPAAFLHKSASQGSLKGLGKGKSALKALAGKTTIKEFIDNIERIEAEFQSYMGSFLLNIEDIQGFARVCQGDVFEITIKYGREHKFKSRISVLKDSRQKCDQRQAVFKARIADVIAIKAYECKGLGKRLLLGHKLCETRDLFTARSQLMTVSLNQTGSIKLNLIITWNPLHLAPQSSLALQPGVDISHMSLPAAPARQPLGRPAATRA